MYVHGVVVRVSVSVGVGLRVGDGQRQLGDAGATRSAHRRVGVVESVWGRRGDGGVGGQRWRCAEACAPHHPAAVARVGRALLDPLMGKRGSAAGRALPPWDGHPVRQHLVLQGGTLHVVAVMVVVGWRWWRLLLLSSNSSSSTVAVAVLGVQSLELGRHPCRTAAARVRLADVA